MTSQTAKQLFAQMEATRAAMALTRCRCCSAKLDIFVQPLHPKSTRQPSTYGTCRTVGCAKENVTLEINDLHMLTADQVASFQKVG